MRVLRHDCSDTDVLDAVAEWAALLAEDDYSAAVEFTHRPHPSGSSGDWTPELLRTVIRNYGSVDPWPDGRTFRVTPLDEATGDRQPDHSVDWWDRGAEIVGSAWFDLPLNGEWSDLTATFEIHRIETGLALVLDQVHVM